MAVKNRVLASIERYKLKSMNSTNQSFKVNASFDASQQKSFNLKNFIQDFESVRKSVKEGSTSTHAQSNLAKSFLKERQGSPKLSVKTKSSNPQYRASSTARQPSLFMDEIQSIKCRPKKVLKIQAYTGQQRIKLNPL